MDSEFHRIKRLPPYVFAEVNRMKAQARADGEDIIDFGMGNPDMPTPRHIVEKLVETVQNPRTHRYSNSRGIPGLRKAIAAYYARRFGVELDPETEVIVTLGSKEGLANLAQAITSPGDVIVVPNPSYPIHAFGFMIAGAAIPTAISCKPALKPSPTNSPAPLHWFAASSTAPQPASFEDFPTSQPADALAICSAPRSTTCSGRGGQDERRGWG